MPELAFYRHGEELLRVTLGDRTEIGRAPECDVVLPDPAISRLHAVVERRGEAYHLLDRSGRGTRVGLSDVPEAELQNGVEVVFGNWRALFRVQPPGDDAATRTSGRTAIRKVEEPVADRPARLRVRSGGHERTVPLPGGGLTVGKDSASDLVLDDPFVSLRHAKFERQGGRWTITDLGSTNGTLLSGARISHGEVLPGATVSIGDIQLTLEVERTPGETTPAGEAFEGMVSLDPGMRQVFEVIERVAGSDAAVTILGETGTGKELVARALHARSPRRDRAFIPVNCSAIAESLIESELFGHERGAFSGADRMRKGAFEEADGGTLFLDEIGELPIDLQPKLLRALELGEVKRVGATRPIQVSTRIVAATHRDLRAQVRAGKFREDLYYRLSVVPIHIPPLRNRRSDVRPLAQHFLSLAAPRGTPVTWSEEALAKLAAYDWPGNVRQLRNVVQRALLFRGEGFELGADALAFEDPRGVSPSAGDDGTLYVRGLTMDEIEREAIRLSLRRHRGRRMAVAKELQIAKSTVVKRIAQWGLQDEGRAGLEPGEEEEDETRE